MQMSVLAHRSTAGTHAEGKRIIVSKVALLVKTKTQPGKRSEVRRLWDEHLRPRVEANAAQEVYFFCEDTQDPDTFYLFEIYANQEAMGENAGAAWFADYLRAVGPLLTDQSEVSTAVPVWAKGAAL